MAYNNEIYIYIYIFFFFNEETIFEEEKAIWLARIILYYIGCIQPMSHSEVKDDYNDISSLINLNPSMDILISHKRRFKI